MQKIKQGHRVNALGMMSGTSLDAVDVAHIVTDGQSVASFGAWASYDFPTHLRDALRALMHGRGDALAIEHSYTLFVAECVRDFMAAHDLVGRVDVFGFHGQTITHRPEEGITWQLGNGALLAAQIATPVVADFRRADMAAGGQGAPLVPLYHAALARDMPKPVAIINIGGVANVTYLGEELLAFDTGPGNALINDWVQRCCGAPYDPDGRHARAGEVDRAMVDAFMAHPYFQQTAPKSLDRDSFAHVSMAGKSLEDGAATLTAMTVASIADACRSMGSAHHLICGGGRHNATMMQWLADALSHVAPVESVGWRGDALEAEAFAYLAARHLAALPLTLPSTTGVIRPQTGGAFYHAPDGVRA